MRVWQHFDLRLTSNSSVSGGVSNSEIFVFKHVYIYILYMLMFCYATCCVEAFILLMWCCVPAFAFEVDDQMLKCVVTGCWKIWLVAESCTYGWEVNHVPCLSQNGITASTSWDSFLGWGRGYWNQIWWGGVFIYLCATGFFFMTCGNLFFFCLVKWTFFYKWAVLCASLTGFWMAQFPSAGMVCGVCLCRCFDAVCSWSPVNT